jgi:hypothetical protein
VAYAPSARLCAPPTTSPRIASSQTLSEREPDAEQEQMATDTVDYLAEFEAFLQSGSVRIVQDEL